MNSPLSDQDPEVYGLIKQEKKRQIEGIELIASENFTSRAVTEALGSCLTNKYSEGYPGKRYYGGNEFIDKLELLCQSRALQAFGLLDSDWAVNVQPYSGSPANFEVYTGLLKPHDRIMGLDLPSGGHLTHGFYTAKTKVSATSVYFESLPYKVDPKTGLVDFERLRESALTFRPKILICGGSAYARDWDYKKFREIANEVNAVLMCDMAHFSGLVASKLVQNPFEYCDIVTTTTHKTLRGPRSGLIFVRKLPLVPSGWPNNIESAEIAINQAVFPGCQGGPHNHQIAAVAVQLKEVMSDDFHKYAKNVIMNAQCIANCLMEKGQTVVSGGTDTHLVLWDLRSSGITGGQYQILCDELAITLNKNSVPGDTSALNPGGVRIGSPAMTSRGCNLEDFQQISTFLLSALDLAKKIHASAASTSKVVKLADFSKAMSNFQSEIQQLRSEVVTFSQKLSMPGLTTGL